MTARWLKQVVGFALIGFAVYLLASPAWVGRVLGRPATTTAQWINLRASWAGPVLGFGGFVLWLHALRPWLRTTLGLLGWSMAGVGAARAVGLAIEGLPTGWPGTKQLGFLIVEILLALGCALAIRAMDRRAAIAGR